MSAGKKQQKHKRITVISASFIFCTVICGSVRSDETISVHENPHLNIYLPREVTVKNDTVELGQVSIVQGAEAIVAKASRIGLGQFSVPGQQIVIDKQIVLSRLASIGIPGSQVTLTGAEQIKIKQQQCIITAEEFVRQAESFLAKNLSVNSSFRWSPIREPMELVITETGNGIGYRPELVQSSGANQVSVEIVVFSGEDKIGTRQVTFIPQYNNRQAVTLTDITAGTIISEENVKIETILSSSAESDDWTSPYGLVAKRSLPANTVIRPSMIGHVEVRAVVKRNQNVVIRIEKPGFLITAVGKSMQDGKVGEYIRVRNVDSQRIITAKVKEDLSVEPVF